MSWEGCVGEKCMSKGCWLHRPERRGEWDHWYNGMQQGAGSPESWARHLQPRPTAAALSPSLCTLLKPWGKVATLHNSVDEAWGPPSCL